MPADQVTTFSYNNDGTLHTVTAPDPTANNTSTVTYTYTFDTLGRPLTIRRPDSTTLANQSGANISYNGLVTTSSEALGTGVGGGQVATTKTIKDAFGRVIEVDEATSASVNAITTYGYDPADNVVSIVAPGGATTTMTHDFAGHRTQITRNGRTWTYTYDQNGNLSTENFPGSTAHVQPDLAFTNIITYDNLDRPVSRQIGQRNLSGPDAALFGAAYESMLWDLGSNGNGTMGFLYSYAPNASLPTTSTQYNYDLQGREENTIQQFSGFPSTVSQQTSRLFTLGGGQQSIRYFDTPVNGTSTWSNLIYDNRGLLSSAQLTPAGTSGVQTLGVQTRNVAGLVTKRHTDVTTGPMTFVESNWTYDKLGRITNQVVQKGPGPTQIARQALAYFAADDPKTLDHYLGTGTTNHKHFTYAFDWRHQLTTVGETALPNAFTAAYTYSPAGRFLTANETAAALPNSDVRPRNVNYQYNGTDPEEVTALTNVSNGAVAWAFAYDAAGNQTMRCSGAIVSNACTGTDETDYVYDGKDRLRRATRKLGGIVQGNEEYWYDGHDARNIVVKHDGTGAKTETIWFTNEVEGHYDGSNNWVHSYAHIGMGTPVARVDTGSTLVGKVEYQFHGLASNTLAAVDQSTGTVNTSLDVAPFGEVIEATDAGSGSGAGFGAHRRRLNDKFVDAISDLTYYGARYYDRLSMSWTEGDPLYRFAPDLAQQATPRRAGIYSFELNNPLRYLDPDGLDAEHPSLAKQGGGLCMASPTGQGCVMDSGDAAYMQQRGTEQQTAQQEGNRRAMDDIASGHDRVRFAQLSATSKHEVVHSHWVFGGDGCGPQCQQTAATVAKGLASASANSKAHHAWYEYIANFGLKVWRAQGAWWRCQLSGGCPDINPTHFDEDDGDGGGLNANSNPNGPLPPAGLGGGVEVAPSNNGWTPGRCSGPGSVCGGRSTPFASPEPPFNPLCDDCFFKVFNRRANGNDVP